MTDAHTNGGSPHFPASNRVSDEYLRLTLSEISRAKALDSQMISTAFLRMLVTEIVERRVALEPPSNDLSPILREIAVRALALGPKDLNITLAEVTAIGKAADALDHEPPAPASNEPVFSDYLARWATVNVVAHEQERSAREDYATALIAWQRAEITRLQQQKQSLLSALNAKQAKIDALMLEFCPGEMSAEQRAEYGRAQRAVDEPPRESADPRLSAQSLAIARQRFENPLHQGLFAEGFIAGRASQPPALNLTPIAKVIVREDGPAQVEMYAPGLPPGEHDVFTVPVDSKGEWRPFRASSQAPVTSHVFVEPVIVADEPGAHVVKFKVGVQEFHIGREYCESREHAEWFAERFREALLRMTQPSSAALRDVATERERQKTAEGWTEAHDDQHDPGELAAAATAYGLHASDVLSPVSQGDGDYRMTLPPMWPWDADWWKPSGSGTNQNGARRDLVKAGALILAEIERLDRATATKLGDAP